MAISTDTLQLAIAALDRDLDRIASIETDNEDEASDNGQLVLDMTRALGELGGVLETRQAGGRPAMADDAGRSRQVGIS